MKRLFSFALIFLSFGGMVFSQSGRTMYVAVNSAEVKSSTGFFSSTVAALALGDPVTVIREDGKWMEVRTAHSQSGWIAAASLTSKRVIGEVRSASASEIALAGKGFSPEVEAEYRANGLDYSAVDAMENLNVPPGDLLKFINDGRLSRGE